MRKRKPSRVNRSRKRKPTGRQARAGRRTLRSEKIGALPILNHFIQRLRLEEWLRECLPPEDKRVKVPAAKALLVLLRNLLISREPLYGMGEWDAGYAPHLLGLTLDELEALSNDGVGQALNCLFRSEQGAFVLAAVRHTIREFERLSAVVVSWHAQGRTARLGPQRPHPAGDAGVARTPSADDLAADSPSSA